MRGVQCVYKYSPRRLSIKVFDSFPSAYGKSNFKDIKAANQGSIFRLGSSTIYRDWKKSFLSKNWIIPESQWSLHTWFAKYSTIQMGSLKKISKMGYTRKLIHCKKNQLSDVLNCVFDFNIICTFFGEKLAFLICGF